MRSARSAAPRSSTRCCELVRDKDEDIRRAAIEILNQTKDERAIKQLIEATRDADWWVSERAVDALAEIGSKRAVPRLVRNAAARATPRPCRSWCAPSASSATPSRVDLITPLLNRGEKEMRVEAIPALAQTGRGAARRADPRRSCRARRAIRINRGARRGCAP